MTYNPLKASGSDMRSKTTSIQGRRIEVFEYLAKRTWVRLARGQKNKIRQSETTITENNLLDLSFLPGVETFVDTDEKNTGLDWEWWIEKKKGTWWRFAIQAKKLEKSGRYEQLNHKVGGKLQLDIFQDFATANPCIPLYCFYNSDYGGDIKFTKDNWRCCSYPFVVEQLGCMLVPLKVVQEALKDKPRKRFDVINMSKSALPWRCAFTCNLLYDRSLTRIDESSELVNGHTKTSFQVDDSRSPIYSGNQVISFIARAREVGLAQARRQSQMYSSQVVPKQVAFIRNMDGATDQQLSNGVPF